VDLSPDGNENPAVRKAIFSWDCRATKGSSCNCSRKKAFGTRSCNGELEIAAKINYDFFMPTFFLKPLRN
jgi:hypothetical protein